MYAFAGFPENCNVVAGVAAVIFFHSTFQFKLPKQSPKGFCSCVFIYIGKIPKISLLNLCNGIFYAIIFVTIKFTKQLGHLLRLRYVIACALI
jgi:hypothetical protein